MCAASPHQEHAPRPVSVGEARVHAVCRRPRDTPHRDAAIGAGACGSLTDPYETRPLLAACTAVFGAFQIANYYAGSLESLLVLRFLAGLGLGGAAPCFLGLAASSVPFGRRTRSLAMVWAFFPIGGFVGGFLNGWIAASTLWQMVFLVGGIPPLVVAALLTLVFNQPASTVSGPNVPARFGLLRLAARDPALARARSVRNGSLHVL